MKTTKIKPVATIVAQFAAGVEIDAIIENNKIYLPVYGGEEFGLTTSTPKKSEDAGDDEEEETPKATSKSTTSKATSTSKKYSEEEMMEMETRELLGICKKLGIDPDKKEGKNTNKKLRLLILAAQEGGSDEDEDDEDDEDDDAKDEDEAPKKKGGVLSQVKALLEDFDAGKKNKKKTISALAELSEDVDEDKLTEMVDTFSDDADADLDEMAEQIADLIEGKAKPTKKSPKKKEELVDADDLEVGDRVSVYWNDDNQQWFDGEVKSIKKGKITIAYDDGTEEAIDPEVHTKIKRLAD